MWLELRNLTRERSGKMKIEITEVKADGGGSEIHARLKIGFFFPLDESQSRDREAIDSAKQFAKRAILDHLYGDSESYLSALSVLANRNRDDMDKARMLEIIGLLESALAGRMEA